MSWVGKIRVGEGWVRMKRGGGKKRSWRCEERVKVGKK